MSVVNIPKKFFEMSDYLANQDLENPHVIGLDEEIFKLLEKWFIVSNVVNATAEDFIFRDFYFEEKILDSLPNEEENLLKLMSFAEANCIICLFEYCAMKLSEKKLDFSKIPPEVAIEIIKYYIPSEIVKQPKEILKHFTYNPTFTEQFEDLFDIKTLYLPSKRYIYSDKHDEYHQEECFKDKPYKVEYRSIVHTRPNDSRLIFNNLLRIEELYLNDTQLTTFQNMYCLKKIKLPEGLTVLKTKAFENCFSLEEIEFPKSLNEIESECFVNCTNLKEIYLLNTQIKFIKRYTFSRCINLRKITLPKTLEQIDVWAFDRCIQMNKFRIFEYEKNDKNFFYDIRFLDYSWNHPNSKTDAGVIKINNKLAELNW